MNRKILYPLVLGVLGAAVVAAVVILITFRKPVVNIGDILASYSSDAEYKGLTIVYPLDQTVFPPEIVAPTFHWKDSNTKCNAWLVALRFEDGGQPMHFLAYQPEWTASAEQWETIKKRSLEKPAHVAIVGVNSSKPGTILSGTRILIMTAKDPVGAPIFYREVNLPFIDAVKDPSRIRWRFGSISSPQLPPVILEKLPVCGNCHSFSWNGQTLAMDVDYANSKGSYVITKVAQEMILATSDIITWDDYKREDGEQTFGLLSQISPDGRYVVSTVKDKSVFVPMPRLAFSQLFFPIKGILCVYDREKKTFFALPGADDPQYVQSNPTWSPDGRYIVFAKAKAYDLKDTKGMGKILLTPEECREFTEDGKPFLFDLYKIPFNEGKGGTPKPIEGASNNGVSNFFPKYSPDGKWIVFCRAKSYMLLQPDSELYIIPAQGGQARRLRCNTNRMNSWHSWSPNGKWLVFSSKTNTDYTQLFITHINEEGSSTPAVVLSRFTSPDRAANIPEFVNISGTTIKKIHEKFLNDYSFVRAGNESYRHGDPNNAIEEYQNALKLNPNNVEAHQKLGFLLYHVKGDFKEGLAHLRKTLELDPGEVHAHYDLGMAMLHQQKLDDAIRHLSEALRLAPQGLDDQYNPIVMNYHLGEAMVHAGQTKEAIGYLSRVIATDPNHAQAHYKLAIALADQGKIDEPVEHYREAVRIQPNVDTSPVLHYLLGVNYAQARRFEEAISSTERALSLARANGDSAMIEKLQQWMQIYKQVNTSRKKGDN